MLCSLSGEPITGEAVVSVKTGHVYERRALDKYLASSGGRCPVTSEPMGPQDLVTLKQYNPVSMKRPRPATSAGIPELLSSFQAEWDAVALEVYTLKRALEAAKQELASTLYRHDAACRVIARLVRERDEARSLLADLRSSQAVVPAVPAAAAQPVAQNTDTGLIERIEKRGAELVTARKKRVMPEGQAGSAAVEKYELRGALAVPQGKAAVCFAHSPAQSATCLGCADGSVLVYETMENAKEPMELEGTPSSKSAVARVVCRPKTTPSLVLCGYENGAVRVWNFSDDVQKKPALVLDLQAHESRITGLDVHPVGDVIVTSGTAAGPWAVWSLASGGSQQPLVRGTSTSQISALAVHPDGGYLATAEEDCVVRMWDLKSNESAAVSFEGHSGPITDVSFSENGYVMASSSLDGTVRLWDLRKNNNFYTMSPTEKGDKSVMPVRHASFDPWGTLLVATTDSQFSVMHCSVKKSEVVASWKSEDGDNFVHVLFSNLASSVLALTRAHGIQIYTK